jgi:hypothetical protein
MSWLVYDKFWSIEKFAFWKSTNLSQHSELIVLCLLLSPINWLLETMKWKLLITPIQKLSWQQLAESIMSGITLGILTPARLGEYGGRLIYINEGNRSQALFAHFTGSLAQNIAIFGVGGIGAVIYFYRFVFYNEIITASILGFTSVFIIALLLLFLRNDWLSNLVFNLSWVKIKIGNLSSLIYEQKDLLKVLFLSFIRHGIYMSQYVILMYIFDINISLLNAYASVGLIYLLQSSLALPPALGLVARSELAIIVLKLFEPNTAKLLSIPLLLWIVNLLIPAIMGMFVILGTNFVKKYAYS